MRSRAWRPDGLGVPGHWTPSPYALRVEKDPHRTQNRIPDVPPARARACPLLVMASTVREALGPSHLWHARAAERSLLMVICMHRSHRHMPEAKIH